MVGKHIKKYSNSLIVRKMQGITSMRYHYTPEPMQLLFFKKQWAIRQKTQVNANWRGSKLSQGEVWVLSFKRSLRFLRRVMTWF